MVYKSFTYIFLNSSSVLEHADSLGGKERDIGEVQSEDGFTHMIKS